MNNENKPSVIAELTAALASMAERAAAAEAEAEQYKKSSGEFKKQLEIVGGQIVDKTTGELVEGVQIIEKPDTFTVDV